MRFLLLSFTKSFRLARRLVALLYGRSPDRTSLPALCLVISEHSDRILRKNVHRCEYLRQLLPEDRWARAEASIPGLCQAMARRRECFWLPLIAYLEGLTRFFKVSYVYCEHPSCR